MADCDSNNVFVPLGDCTTSSSTSTVGCTDSITCYSGSIADCFALPNALYPITSDSSLDDILYAVQQMACNNSSLIVNCVADIINNTSNIASNLALINANAVNITTNTTTLNNLTAASSTLGVALSCLTTVGVTSTLDLVFEAINQKFIDCGCCTSTTNECSCTDCDWSSSTIYSIGNLVYHNSKYFRAINTATDGGVPVVNQGIEPEVGGGAVGQSWWTMWQYCEIESVTDTNANLSDIQDIAARVSADFVYVTPTTSTTSLELTIAGGEYIINGKYVSGGAIVNLTANKDAYVYVNDQGAHSVSEVSTGSDQPATPANSVALVKVVSGTSITSVTSVNVNSAPVTEAQLQDDSISTDKIKSQAVTGPKIANDAVDEAQLKSIDGITAGTYTNPSVTITSTGRVSSISSGASPSSVALNDITDVTVPATATDGDVLVYNSSLGKWIREDLTTRYDRYVSLASSSLPKTDSFTLSYTDFASASANTVTINSKNYPGYTIPTFLSVEIETNWESSGSTVSTCVLDVIDGSNSFDLNARSNIDLFLSGADANSKSGYIQALYNTSNIPDTGGWTLQFKVALAWASGTHYLDELTQGKVHVYLTYIKIK